MDNEVKIEAVDTDNFCVIFKGDTARKTFAELTEMWGKDKREVVELAVELLYRVSVRKKQFGETLCLMNNSGVLTIIDLE